MTRTAALVALALTTSAMADVKLAPIFTDHMVLQRQSLAPVWGWERPGVKVTVTGSWGASAEATADENGRWRANLQTPDAGGPFELSVRGDTGVTLRDVWVGEVWLASGQSNMEWPLSATEHAEADVAAADASFIRFFTVSNQISLHPRSDIEAAWTVVTPASAPDLSAVAYHFAREISGVDSTRLGMPMPIGIIAADWGGTRIEAWMDAESLARFGAYDAELATIEQLKDPVAREPLMADAAQSWWDRLDSLPGQPGNGWTGLNFNDDSWATMALPASWTGDLANFDGMVRFRRTIELPTSWAGKAAVLELGPIDDRDDAWINGVHVGGMRADGAWQVARRYEVPAGVLKAGANVVSVRAYDTGGLGGINGRADQMRLSLKEAAAAPAAERAPVALGGDWRYQRGTAAAQLPPQSQPVNLSANTATALYNAMIHPLIPFKVRGVIWYQGESNRGNAPMYADLMRSWIALWRDKFEGGDMPFYWVQIAPYGYPSDRGQTVALREAQADALDVAHTGMVVTTDIGDNTDIHPRNKREVGRRLGLLALRNTYANDDVVASGPTYVSSQPVAGGAMQVNLASAEGLRLAPTATGVSGFEIAGEDQRFHPASAQVTGNAIVVRSPNVATPRAVRFNWSRSPEANLFNAAGLPAAPFRTDNWADDTVTRGQGLTIQSLRSQEPGFVPLFQGTDLTGWTFVNATEHTWTVASDADGAYIHCTGIPTGVLRTDKQYENFIVELEYRHMVPNGNAGFFVWSDPIPVCGAPFTRSVEVQVMDGQEGNGFTSDGDIFPIWGATMTPINGRQGSSRAFPTERRSNPAPMWNHYRVECIDGRITLAVNGKVVTQGHSISPRRGYICLESEGTEVHFRNIRIKELPASTPAIPAEQQATVAQGFRPLYNGVNFEGWDFKPEHEGHWRADDWTIGFDGQGADLWSKQSFKDFVLICDWRWTTPGTPTDRPVILPDGSVKLNADGSQAMQSVIDAGDSGIYLRGSSKSQVNMWCWPIGSGEVYGYRTDSAMPASVRAGVTPRAVADAPIGQWNRFEITMRGEHLTVVLNGQTVLENAHLPGVAAEGPIALQMHGNPIEFANIYIRPLE